MTKTRRRGTIAEVCYIYILMTNFDNYILQTCFRQYQLLNNAIDGGLNYCFLKSEFLYQKNT